MYTSLRRDNRRVFFILGFIAGVHREVYTLGLLLDELAEGGVYFVGIDIVYEVCRLWIRLMLQ